MLFKIYKGTKVQVIKEDVPLNGSILKNHITKNNNIFEIDDMIIDPSGEIGSPSGNRIYGSQGYYGFRKNGWIMIVHHLKVGIIT